MQMRRLWSFAWILLLPIGYVLMLALLQHKLIYHPRPYDSYEYAQLVGSEFEEIRYRTSEGEQVAFYRPPTAGAKTPEFLWVFFSGNASLALNWAWLIQQAEAPGVGFLLIDYPGYGQCEGTASPKTILESAEQGLQETWALLGVSGNTGTPALGVFGHSLGAATGLQFAVRYPLRKVVLIAPFTSMEDMAALVVGRWGTPFLRHNFDNRARLQELLKRDPAPEIHLFHGTADETVPVSMGRELAGFDLQKISYSELPKSTHNSILDDAHSAILTALKP